MCLQVCIIEGDKNLKGYYYSIIYSTDIQSAMRKLISILYLEKKRTKRQRSFIS